MTADKTASRLDPAALLAAIRNRFMRSGNLRYVRTLQEIFDTNALCGWLLHSKTFLIRFVHLSEAVMCPACLRGFDRWP